MNTYRILRDNIVTLMGELDTMQEIHRRPTFDFHGFPAAFVVPVGNDNEFSDTHNNLRTYTYKIWIFVEYDEAGAEKAYNNLMDCCEEVLNIIDVQTNPDAPSVIMQTGLESGVELLKVEAALGSIVPDADQKMMGAEVTVRCGTLVQLNLI